MQNNSLLPARHFDNEEAFIAHFLKESKLIIDATEFKIQRPSHPEKQVQMYSGKKKS